MGIFDPIKRGLKRAGKLMGDAFAQIGAAVPTARDLRLDAHEWVVKRKLGSSFFTRRMTANQKHARMASLTDAEFALAQERGWVPKEIRRPLDQWQRKDARDRRLANRRARAEQEHRR